MATFDRLKRLLSGGTSGKISESMPLIESLGNSLSEGMKSVDFKKYGNDPKLNSILQTLFTNVGKTRKEFLEQIKTVENFYLVETIINSIIDEAITPDISSGDIFNIRSENQKINDILEEFQVNFDLDSIVQDFLPEMLLRYGEYYLRPVVEKGKGIVEIFDDVDPNEMISLYKSGFPYQFLRITSPETDTEGRSRMYVTPPYHYAHFILNGRKLRTKVDARFVRDLPENIKSIPNHVRIGRPLLYGVISKIRELEVLEKLVPGTRLASITNGSIVGVEVPPATDPKSAFDIAKRYEELFNLKTAINAETGDMSAADILNVAGRIKVIPTFGGKGNINPVDSGATNSVVDLQQSVVDTREVICSSIGFPSGLIYNGMSRGEMLKQNARYLKKIKSIQDSIIKGITQLCLIHITNLDETIEVSHQDIIVEFNNESVNLDELEKLEYLDARISFIKSTIDFIGQLEALGMSDIVDRAVLRDWLSDKIEFLKTDNHQSPDGKARYNDVKSRKEQPLPPSKDPDGLKNDGQNNYDPPDGEETDDENQ
jgi:hypothetical protein